MPSREELELVVTARDRAKSILGNVKKQILSIGAAYLSWNAAKKIVGDLVSAGLESERVWNDVKASLDRHGYSVDRNIDKVQRFASQLQDLTGISDEVTGQSIQMLLDYNNDLATSYDLVKVAADLAAGGHMDMKAAVDLVGKASVGYTGTLSRYGIIIDESIPKQEKFAAAIEQINQRFGGAAAARMETTAGKIELLSQKIEDLYQAIYQRANAPSTEGASLSNAVTNLGQLFDLATDLVNQDWDTIWKRLTMPREAFESWKNMNQEMERNYENLLKEIGLIQTTGDETVGFSDNLTSLINNLQGEQAQLDANTQAWIDYANAIASGALAVSPLAGDKLSEEYNKLIDDNIEDRSRKTALAEEKIERDMVRRQKEGMDKILALNAEMLDKKIEASKEADKETVDYLIAVNDKASREVSRIYVDLADSFKEVMSSASWEISSALVDAMNGVNVRWTEIFKDMFNRFMTYFLDKVIKNLAERLANSLTGGSGDSGGGFGDWGSVLGGVFGKPAPSPTTEGSVFMRPAAVYNYNFNGPVTDSKYVTNYIAPIMEKASRRGSANFQIKKRFITGEAIYGS